MRRSRFPAPLLLAGLALLAGCRPDEFRAETPDRMPVRYETVRPGPHQATLTLFGTVRPSETLRVLAPQGGRISYPARFPQMLRTGETVRAGEVLAFLDNPDAQLALAEARLSLELASENYERLRRGEEHGLYSKQDIREAEIGEKVARERLRAAEKAARRLQVAAPREGSLVVTDPYPAGSDVAGGALLAEIAVTGPPRIEGWAAAGDLAELRPGLSVRFRRPGEKEAIGEGKVTEVATVVDAAGTVRVVAEAADPAGLPAPGEGIELLVALDVRNGVFTVPEEAVLLGSGTTSLFVLVPSYRWGDTREARRTPVETGRRGGGRIEIARGLKEGDRVAVSGIAFLSDGTPVQEVEAEAPAGSTGATGSGGK